MLIYIEIGYKSTENFAFFMFLKVFLFPDVIRQDGKM